MSSRMSKYYEEDELANSRVKRNEELYKEINKSELNSYSVKSNATVLGDNENEIDVEKIKKILDTKYNEVPKRKSIRLDTIEEEKCEKEITKEYDINVILEKAKEQKEDNYEEERFKQNKGTEIDILKNLNVSKDEDIDDEDKEEDSDDLQNLINTIYDNEKESSSSSPLDILTDLKGSGDTEVLEGLKEEVEEKEQEELTNSFYTESNVINTKDFEDADDFAKDINSSNTFIKILIVIVVILFIVGVALVVKSLFF